ncbi:MAG: hypothetical protein HZB31_04595 [Nitrospirae bacterium]|nr:hypothetical protein [Nitrospirota bacterium]
MKYLRTVILLIVTVSLASGCAFCPPIDPKQKLIMQFDDSMIPLAKSVEVTVGKLSPDAKDQAIFDEVIKRSGDPGLTKPFAGYLLRARIEGDTAVILLCYPDGKEGIIEDVTCTTRPDMHRPSKSPCEYMLDVKKVCATR